MTEPNLRVWSRKRVFSLTNVPPAGTYVADTVGKHVRRFRFPDEITTLCAFRHSAHVPLLHSVFGLRRFGSGRALRHAPRASPRARSSRRRLPRDDRGRTIGAPTIVEAPLLLASVSGWYRLRPEVAVGLTYAFLYTGANTDWAGPTPLGGDLGLAFVDGRFLPESIVGPFARLSAGVAYEKVVPADFGNNPLQARLGPAFELEGGLELKSSYTRRREQQLNCFVRLGVGFIAMPLETRIGVGLTLGFEG